MSVVIVLVMHTYTTAVKALFMPSLIQEGNHTSNIKPILHKRVTRGMIVRLGLV